MPKEDYKIVRSNSRPLRYSMYDFIEAVKQHPLLWNRNHDGFHVRERRECAWNSVARQLYKGYESATPVDKKTITLTLTKRWKNARDIFYRVYRHNQNAQKEGTKLRQYVYEKEMNFLLHQDHVGPRVRSRTRSSTTRSISKSSSRSPVRRLSGKQSKHDNRNQKKQSRATGTSSTAVGGAGDGALVCTSGNVKKKPSIADSVKKRTDSIVKDASIASMKKRPSPGRGEHCLLPAIKDIDCDGEQSLSVREEKMCHPFEAPVTSTKSFDSSIIAPFMPGTNANHSAGTSLAPERNTNFHNFTSHDNISELRMINSVRAICPPTRYHTHEELDANQLFFDSIKPVICELSVENRLDFQIEVLRLLKRYTTGCKVEY